MLQEEQTPLHIASRLGKTEIVQLLLQHMAHPDAATASGHTPLHISAREGQVGVAAVLLEAGAAHSSATKVRGGPGTSAGATWVPLLGHSPAQGVGGVRACGVSATGVLGPVPLMDVGAPPLPVTNSPSCPGGTRKPPSAGSEQGPEGKTAFDGPCVSQGFGAPRTPPAPHLALPQRWSQRPPHFCVLTTPSLTPA